MFLLALTLVCLFAAPLLLWFAVTQPLLLPPRAGAGRGAAIEPARLEAHVRALAETYAPRDEGHTENLDRAAGYIRGEFERAKGEVSEQVFAAGGKIYRNVSALFGPAAGERIVVGAHYDAAGELPGADDNASGVAGLIELAHLLGRTPPAAPVELVAYTLEEPPYFRTPDMGSAHHARALRERGVGVRLMISLEMIGYFSDAPGSQAFPVSALGAFYPSRGDFIAVVGSFGQMGAVRRVKGAMRAASTLPVYSINAPRAVPGVDFSDQMNYWEAGYDAVMVTDTAFYRNGNYHTAHDTPDTLDYVRMASVVRGVYAAVLADAGR